MIVCFKKIILFLKKYSCLKKKKKNILCKASELIKCLQKVVKYHKKKRSDYVKKQNEQLVFSKLSATGNDVKGEEVF